MLTRFRCSPHQPPFLPSSFPPTTQYNDIQQKLSRFHTLSATSPDRKGLAQEMDADCDSIKYQVSLTREEVGGAWHAHEGNGAL